MASNLFIVITPFQLLCAIEARREFCSEDAAQLVVLDREDADHQSHIQLTRLIDEKWASVTRLRETKRRGLLRSLQRAMLTVRLAIVLISKGGWRQRAVFLGEPRNSWFGFLARRFGKTIVWLDDGAASIFLLARLRRERKFRPVENGMPVFFTIFGNAMIEAETEGAIIRNRMKSISGKTECNSLIVPRQAIFAGQWISESGDIEREAELACLAAMRDVLVGWDISYVPHRLESPEKLKLIAQLGFPITPLGQPLELELLGRTALPELLVSWYSTVLFTAHTLFPAVSVRGVQIPLTVTDSKRLSNLLMVYGAMSESGIRVVQTNNLSQLLPDPVDRK